MFTALISAASWIVASKPLVPNIPRTPEDNALTSHTYEFRTFDPQGFHAFLTSNPENQMLWAVLENTWKDVTKSQF